MFFEFTLNLKYKGYLHFFRKNYLPNLAFSAFFSAVISNAP